jgi:general secretion pathway protein A
MYLQHFHLKEMPFAIEPNPRFLLLCEDHREALATMVYAVEQQEGWALLLGEAGLGKTTLVMALLRELEDRVVPAVITNPLLEPLDFFNLVAQELHLDGPFQSKGQFLIALGRLISRCRQEGKVLLLVVDESHSLTPRLLEELRLLGNLDDGSPRVLNIFLVGQPRVLKLMKNAGAKGLMQRLRRHHLLKPLSAPETATYVRHRLKVAGGPTDSFEPEALALVHQITGGVPRLINTLCDEAMLAASNRGLDQVDGVTVQEAAEQEPLLAPDAAEAGERAPAAAAPPEPEAFPDRAWPRQTQEPRDRESEEPAAAAGPPGPEPDREDQGAAPWLSLEQEPNRRPTRREPAGRGEQPSGQGQAPPEDRDAFQWRADSAQAEGPAPARGERTGGRPGRRKGWHSRTAAAMSKGRPGSFWRRAAFLALVLLVLAGAYLLTSDTGLERLKRLYRQVTGQSGPTLYMPEALPQDPRNPTTRSQPRGEGDWGPAVPGPANQGGGSRG